MCQFMNINKRVAAIYSGDSLSGKCFGADKMICTYAIIVIIINNNNFF